jgi:hypothetical protein
VTQTDVNTQQQVLKEGAVYTLKGGIWKGGIATLTTERFYRKVRGSALLSYSFGLLGRLINQAFPWRVEIDIPLSSITVIGRGKMGLKKDVLYIETVDGKSYQFMPDYQIWLSALQNALQTYNHATLTQSADERWTVQR